MDSGDHTLCRNISYLWLSLTDCVQELYRGECLFCRTLSRDACQRQILTKHSLIGKASYPPSTWEWEEGGTQGRGINSSSLSCLAQGRSSHEVPSAGPLMPLACDGKKNTKGYQEHLPPTGPGWGCYTGEERDGGEDREVGQILLARSSFCLGWWVWECAVKQRSWISNSVYEAANWGGKKNLKKI